MVRFLFILSTFFVFSSCDYFKNEETRIPVARVNSSYLYQEDIAALISENTSEEDSTLIVNSYINRWATQQILMDRAKVNISETNQEAYDKLAEDYKRDLYTEAYKNKIVSTELDSTISQTELELFYEENKQNFKLNDQLFKLRYIHIDTDFANGSQTATRLERFNAKDIQALETESI